MLNTNEIIFYHISLTHYYRAIQTVVRGESPGGTRRNLAIIVIGNKNLEALIVLNIFTFREKYL